MASKVLIALLVVVTVAASAQALECMLCYPSDAGCTSGQVTTYETCRDLSVIGFKSLCYGARIEGTKDSRGCSHVRPSESFCRIIISREVAVRECRTCETDRCNYPPITGNMSSWTWP
ncbi:hypothetical protein PPYR_13929 [Photinus pyralis]|uniref:Protein quiver n=1 Tax=Photinus pyralis TaxID=7054 RepID=A0A5N4A3V0_PHOPY|nr:uncharacterized protein LOC116181250 [Photinus pyralis]XP_031357416.1 uncharacterized protein LOC116181254 [Photinus pyralis]KAB0791968.1 hypothetical protein PPYR_13929 [Photinus pyralis]